MGCWVKGLLIVHILGYHTFTVSNCIMGSIFGNISIKMAFVQIKLIIIFMNI